MIRKKIENLTKKAIQDAQKKGELPVFKIPEIIIEKPENNEYGDYSVNIALRLSKIAKKNPMEIAKIISQSLNLSIFQSLFEKIEAVKPGFINFFLSKEYLQKQVREILKEKDKFGELKIGKNKKIQVEFISANPTGPLHVGNARGGAFGDVLANVLAKAGFKTQRAYYINDYGMQIMALGHSVLKDEEAQYKGDYINRLNKEVKKTNLFKKKDPYKIGEWAAKEIIGGIKRTVKKMGIEFDEWFPESNLHKKGEVDKVLNFLKKEKLIYEKDGALWFKSSKYGDERDRVMVKSNGWKTYLASDIAYHKRKFENNKIDRAINVWGADHYGDIAGLQAGVATLGYKGKLDIIILQFVTIIQGNKKLKISKRKGTFVAMDDLLEDVSPDVARFFFLQKSADTHLDFDLSLAKEQSRNNPVYYVQYAHARISSILRKAQNNYQLSIIVPAGHLPKGDNYQLLNHQSELNLIRRLVEFPEIVEDTAKDYQVQRIPKYAMDLAADFHRFYGDCQVLTEDKNLQKARLVLLEAAKIVLKNTLDLMGISSPQKM